MKRRISIGQFHRWRKFHLISPFDDRHRDVMAAQQIVLLARAIGDNTVQVDDIVGDPFVARPADDMAAIIRELSG